MLQLYVILLATFAAFGGFMFGYDIGVINGVKDMRGFRSEMNLTIIDHHRSKNGSLNCAGEDEGENALLGLIVSLFSVGCFIGALVAGGLSDLLGRKFSIICGGIVFFTGGAVQSGSIYLWMVLVGRMVAGIGVGILSMVVPVYNAELAPKNLRGRLVSLNQLFITAGIMVSFLVSLATKDNDLFGWRIALGIQCVLAVILVIGMIFLPETPRWLVKKGKAQKAYSVLKKVRHGVSESDIREEIANIEFTVQDSKSSSIIEIFRDLFRWRIFERLILGMLLQLFQQFTGMNVIMYYSTQIFCSINVKSYIATAIVGTVNFLTSILSIFLVDKVGRKSLLLLGALGMFVSMSLAGILIHVFHVDDGENQIVGYVVALLILVFVFNFSFSWGPVAWVVTSEIFPLTIRGVAVSITTSANWIGNFIVAMVTPILLGNPVLGTAGTFYIISVFLFLAFVFVLLTLPETKGESLERIDQLFSKPWLQRINLFYYLRLGCPWSCKNRGHYNISDITLEKSNIDEDEQKNLIEEVEVSSEIDSSSHSN